MEHSPPPLFKQGPSARARLVFFVALSLGVLVVDVRYQAMGLVRQAVALALLPVQALVSAPLKAWGDAADYLTLQTRLLAENDKLKKQHLIDMQALHQLQTLSGDNDQLRKLMGASEKSGVKAILAEIQYDARDPYSRKIVIDKGLNHGVVAGQPVMDDSGILGQVTRVFIGQSEVTLVTDKYQTVPVQIARNGLRSVVYGGQEGGLLELRFMAANADVQKDDVLVTSGIDGLYPAGIPVAKVVQVERKSSYAFARILCEPVAGVNKHRFVLVMAVENPLPPPPPIEQQLEERARKRSARTAADKGGDKK